MRICDLPLEKIVVGLKIRSLKDPSRIGEVVQIDNSSEHEHFSWVLYSGDDKPYGGFYWNHAANEVVE